MLRRVTRRVGNKAPLIERLAASCNSQRPSAAASRLRSSLSGCLSEDLKTPAQGIFSAMGPITLNRLSDSFCCCVESKLCTGANSSPPLPPSLRPSHRSDSPIFLPLAMPLPSRIKTSSATASASTTRPRTTGGSAGMIGMLSRSSAISTPSPRSRPIICACC